MKIISGNSNTNLAQSISEHLKIPLCQMNLKHFKDTELFVEILENVRGQDVFVIQPIAQPANDTLMALLIIIDALRRGSAKRVTAVIPYYGYARQDRKTGPRTPISAKLVANLLTASGAHRVLTMDLHTAQVQGFFDIPVDNLSVNPLFVSEIYKNFSPQETVVVSPDIGGVGRARELAKRLQVDLAVIDKRRIAPGQSDVMNVIGDVENKICILLDDIIDSGGTLCNAAVALERSGASSIFAYVTHGVFANPEALLKIQDSPLREVIVTDTIQVKEEILGSQKIRQLSVASLFAEAIRRIAQEQSLSTLFD